MNRTLAGRYRLTGVVANGATGVLWRGVDHGTDLPVAVKLLHPELAGGRVVDQLRRARPTLSALWHPGIARLLDVVVSDGDVCLVTDFVPGTDLARLLAASRRAPLAPARAAEIAAAVADALYAAHRADVVHGDLKPSNVIVPPRSVDPVRVTDFSVATLVRAGTAAYAPPWVIDGGMPTAASDVHALGVILHEMLAGRPADPRLREVANVCTHSDQTPAPAAGEVAQRLRELAPQLDGAAAPRPRQRGAPPGKRARSPGRTRIAVGAVAAVAVVAGAAAAVGLLNRPGPAAPPGHGATTAAVSAGAPSMPPAAADRTQEGGTDFVQYWFAALTYAVATGDIAPLAEVTSPQCRECQVAIETIDSAHAQGGSLRGGGYVVRRVSTTDLWSADQPVYDVTVDRSPRTVVDATGAAQATLPPLSFANCVLVLEWTDQERWQVREVVSPGCVT